MSELIRWEADLPPLSDPVLVVALEGFVDAGAVASTASAFLSHRWRADRVARFDRDALIDYRARRPTAVVDSGLLRRIEWPDIELLAAQIDAPRDVLLLLGPEPDTRWEAFCDAVGDVCDSAGVSAVISLGAYPAAVPHTRPVRILQAGNGIAGPVEVVAPGIPGYTGPVGAGAVLQSMLGARDIPAIGLWAEVPHYIAGSPNPKAALAMARLVATTLGTLLDTTELEAAAKLHAEQVDEAISDHPEAMQMVTALEEHVDEGLTEADLPSGEAMAAEIERFLRTQGE